MKSDSSNGLKFLLSLIAKDNAISNSFQILEIYIFDFSTHIHILNMCGKYSDANLDLFGIDSTLFKRQNIMFPFLSLFRFCLGLFSPSNN